jgi:hypothetical protein
MYRMSSPFRVKVWIVLSLIIIATVIAYFSRSTSLESEVKRFSASVQGESEDVQVAKEDAFTRKLSANSSYSNSQLIAVALKETTSIAAQSALYLALDERGYKFTSSVIQDYMILNPVSELRGRLTYVRFVRDGDLSTVEPFVKRVLGLERSTSNMRAVTRERAVCWSLARKKYPVLSSLESDPIVGPTIRNLRKVTGPKESQR